MALLSHRPTLLLMLSIAVMAVGAVVSAQRQTAERHVYVRATDAKGVPVQTLSPADVVVREDGIAREVLRIGAAPPPSHIVLLVDNTPAAESVLIELRNSITAFARQMNQLPSPPDMSLVTFADRPTRIVDFTTSDIAIENGVKKIFPRPVSGAYFLDAIIETAAALRKVKAPRAVILAFVMDASPEHSDRVHRHVDEALAEARASLWTIQLQQTAARISVPARERESVVGDVTTWSGGMNRPVLSAQGVPGAYDEMAAVILGRLDITYGRPASLIPPKRMTVEARDKSLRLAAPRWAAE